MLAALYSAQSDVDAIATHNIYGYDVAVLPHDHIRPHGAVGPKKFNKTRGLSMCGLDAIAAAGRGPGCFPVSGHAARFSPSPMPASTQSQTPLVASGHLPTPLPDFFLGLDRKLRQAYFDRNVLS